ncbi:VOC family protein [Nonomuraea rhizosphaerae]|uniref:VOC family protein n=1 Tax=Nonomuraea rhizosphaerae TaxID=2665663 RepID=UPI001C5D3ECF|nr:VOC family protein [Nonomuraea rhizosphaerae]
MTNTSNDINGISGGSEIGGESGINGIDHTGLLTRDLGKLADGYEALGFTLTPPSRHLLSSRPGEPPTLGNTANRCAVFGTSFIELLGIVDPSGPDPWHVNHVPDGFRIFYVGTRDADAVCRRLDETGVPTLGVRSLERDVDTAEGVRRVRARGLHIDPSATPEGFVGIAQHLTPEYVHQSGCLDHPNGARGIGGVLIVAEDGTVAEYVDRYARILRSRPLREGARHVLEVPGGGRVEIVSASEAADALPDLGAFADMGGAFLAAMSIVVDDVPAARSLVDGNGIPTYPAGDGFFVSPRDASGAGLFFTAP